MVRLCRNQWRPDTCGCVVEFEFDADLPGETRTHTMISLTPCSAHAGNTAYINQTIEASAIPVHKENQRKNQTLDTLATELGLPESDPDRYTKLMQYLASWYYDAARVLHIVTKGLTTQQKNRAQNAANTRFGTGIIVIE